MRTVPVKLPHAVVAHAGRRRKIVPVSQCFPRPCRDTMLAKLEQARLLVDQCKTASEAKEVIDVAIAAKVYASRQRVSKDIINSATVLEIDADMANYCQASNKSAFRKSSFSGWLHHELF